MSGIRNIAHIRTSGIRPWPISWFQPTARKQGAMRATISKKFIRAEVVNWQALMDYKGYPGVREKGLLRLEGKEYIVKDGDVLVIRHG